MLDYGGQGRVGGPETAVNQNRKNKVMTIATGKTSSSTSRGQGTLKAIHNAIAKAAMLNPLKMEKISPSWDAIGTRAYEIWMSRGQEQGRDQEHWFEAERQLREA